MGLGLSFRAEGSEASDVEPKRFVDSGTMYMVIVKG